MSFDLTGIRYRDYIVDSAEGSLNSSDDVLGLDRLNLRRKQNELNVRGRYLLPAEVSKFSSQPAEADVALNAPEAGDFWVADSPSRVSGPLQSQAQIEWKQEVASGQLWLAGANLRMRDLVLRQISAQCSISNSDVYVNDFSANLNNTDYVNATGTFSLQPPHQSSGRRPRTYRTWRRSSRFCARSAISQLAGSFKLDWGGSGQGTTAFQPSLQIDGCPSRRSLEKHRQSQVRP